jgi:D-arginine dehydrogenase
MDSFDVVVVGAGMAGASIAYELAVRSRVLLLEMESQPGFHATGRSAALFSEAYGGPAVRALSRASRSFFEAPPDGFRGDILHPRGSLFIANTETEGDLQALAAMPDIARLTQLLSPAQAHAMVGILAADSTVAALFEPDSMDIDVDALHQGYLRGLVARGGKLACNAAVTSIEKNRHDWTVVAGEKAFGATRVVNAAGAWADRVAMLAGAAPCNLSPLRRTIITIDMPEAIAGGRCPMVITADESLYFKPDAGRLLISPADETPDIAGDAQPDELDVAIAADGFERLTGRPVTRILSRWAGLRTFAGDRLPVVGEDPVREGFFWLAGQGGYGIQMAPALARCAASLVEGRALPTDVVDEGFRGQEIAPARFG